ncbi:hypothetical protein [Ostreibacterium oceani]|uniref:PD-(D/E)XK nuclease superfamily protein n=1 Tax=Ostreibacterium oceani TaxID=2654998 RepID=A0A6N7EUH6_9GAMM|nr:hypothetical protein [Ostreibacterium oceani]MPV86434.1 hypothetical protein [Ostreibacterium oceani]
MQKIDYGDINKFLVSIGLVLIALAVLTPYLYLKEDFGLYIEQSKIDQMQEPIKELITEKQNQVIKFQIFIPWVSLSFFLLGLTSTIIGLVRWFKRQSKIDEKFDKELQKLDLEITSLTPEEKEEKAKQEVEEIESVEQQVTSSPVVKPSTHSDYVKAYMQIEKGITEVFENYKSPNFDVLSQQRIGNRYEIDILLQAKTKRFLDRIVEIKYFRNRLSLKIIRDTISRINTQISYYNQASNRRVVPVLLIVYSKETTTADDILKFQNRIIDESQDIPNLNRLNIDFIEENEIKKFDVRRIIKK